YFAFARAWISEVYNTVRNAEIAILLHNKELAAREAMASGPYFAHEIKRVVDQGLATAQRDFAEDRDEAVLTRRHVLYSIRTLCNLAYSFTNAVLSDRTYALKNARDELVTPLQELRREGTLVSDLTGIAEEIYKSVKRQNGGSVNFPERTEKEISVEERSYAACFLLVVEMLRNYCESQPRTSVAEFRTWLHNDRLIIELEGPTRAQRNPTSLSFARLDILLHSLDIGEARTTWTREAETFK